MKTRIIAGLIMAAGVIALLTIAPPWASYLLIQVAVVILMDELWTITCRGGPTRDRIALILAGAALIAAAWWAPEAGLLPTLYGAVMGLLATVLFSPGGVEALGRRVTALLAAFSYAALLVTAMVLIVRGFRTPDDGPLFLLMLFAGVFGGDTGAFFAGKFFGRTKLYEKISPKKTWAGSFGGLAASVAGVFIIEGIFGLGVPGAHLIVLGVGVAVFEQVGDLAESLFKRAHGVKDSGTLIPGHGGLLDRVDGVLFAAPFFWTWLRYVVFA